MLIKRNLLFIVLLTGCAPDNNRYTDWEIEASEWRDPVRLSSNIKDPTDRPVDSPHQKDECLEGWTISGRTESQQCTSGRGQPPPSADSDIGDSTVDVTNDW